MLIGEDPWTLIQHVLYPQSGNETELSVNCDVIRRTSSEEHTFMAQHLKFPKVIGPAGQTVHRDNQVIFPSISGDAPVSVCHEYPYPLMHKILSPGMAAFQHFVL